MTISDIEIQKLLEMSDAEVWKALTGESTRKPNVGKAEMDRRITRITVPVRTAKGDSTTTVGVNVALKSLWIAFYTDLFNYCPDFYVVNDGGYNYRNVRGSSSMSAHAYGAAVDINAHWNPMGYSAPPTTKPSGDRGHYVIYNSKENPVLQIAKKYSLSWGGYWSGRKDGMHFSFIGDWTRAKTKSFYSSW